VVTWRLVTPGWRFSSTSIRFSDSSAPFQCSAYAEGQAMRCVSNGSAGGRFDYSIALRDEAGRPVALPQPTIWLQSE
jgi:hypothetical protein